MKVVALAFAIGMQIGTSHYYAQEPTDPDSAGTYTQEPDEYPEGVVCSPNGVMSNGRVIDADHPCHCKNMGEPQTSCEKPITNDPVCRQYCHEKHCSCPLLCESHVGGAK